MRYSVVLFFFIGILNAAPLVDFGAVAPESIRLHTPGKREQAAGIDTFDRRKALRIDWNNARAGHFEFHTTDKLILPEFLKARITVQAYLPEHCKARNLNLRIVDRDGETFQVYRPLAGLKPGWNEIIYELDSETPGAGSFGAGKKANRKIDFPARLGGFAADFNSKDGEGFLAIGTVEIEIVSTRLPLRPVLETGTAVHVLTPENEAGILLANDRAVDVSGKLEFRVADVNGNPVCGEESEVFLAPGESRRFPIVKPKKFGVYYVDVKYSEFEEHKKPFEKTFRFCYMKPAGPVPGPAKGFLFGGCTHPLGKPVEDQKREALAAALCGIKVMRVDFYWESMQPTAQSELNFKRFDDALRVFEEQGIEFQAIYCYLPKWAAAKDWKPLSMKFTGKPRPDYGLWRRFIRSAAGHYRGKLRYVEVWNEPDHVGFANFSALEYIELMKIAYAETKRADPNMQVLTGGYTCMPNGFVKLVEKDHMQRTLVEGRGAYDIFAFHGHGPFHDYRNQIDRLVKMKKELKVEAPWWANETAISSIHVGELGQGITLYRKLIYSWARGAMGYSWFNLRNNGFDPSENEHNFGLLTRDFYPKAAYGVYNTLARLFREAEYLGDADAGEGIDAFFFRDARGELLLPHWSGASSGSGRVLLLSGISGPVTRIDLFGNEEVLPVCNDALVVEVGETPATLRFAQRETPRICGELFQLADDFICRPGGTGKYRFELMNPTGTSLTFRIEPELSEGLTLKEKILPLRIAPGQKKTVTLRIAADKNFRYLHNRQEMIGIALAVDDLWEGVLHFKARCATPLNRGLAGQPDFVLESADQIITLVANHPDSAHLFWKGGEDLSAEVRLGHDGTALLLKVDVRDDIHCQPYRGGRMYQGDGIQFALQLPDQKGLWEIGLSRRDDGENDVHLWHAPEGFDPSKTAAEIQLETRRDEAKKVTGYTVRIPFMTIGLNRNVGGGAFRFNLLVNDNDGEGRESYIAIAPGIGESKTPDEYPVVIFH